MSKALLYLSLLMLLTKQSLGFQPSNTKMIQPGKSYVVPTMQRHAPSPLSKDTHKYNLLLAQNKKDEDENKSTNKILGVVQKNPGTIIMIPFVALFGLDLIANILVVTKRSLEGEFCLLFVLYLGVMKSFLNSILFVWLDWIISFVHW